MQFLPELAKLIQSPVGWIGSIALYTLVGATLIGYFPNMISIVGTGAILVGLLFVLAAFTIGYLMGGRKDHLQDVGGLGTGQRNTAAGMIIAVQNFSRYPDVLVMLTLGNTLGIVMLMFIAKRLNRDNKVGDGKRSEISPDSDRVCFTNRAGGRHIRRNSRKITKEE